MLFTIAPVTNVCASIRVGIGPLTIEKIDEEDFRGQAAGGGATAERGQVNWLEDEHTERSSGALPTTVQIVLRKDPELGGGEALMTVASNKPMSLVL